MNTAEQKDSKVKIEVELEIDEQRIKDLLTTALEGGSNYWYIIKSFNYPEGRNKQNMHLEFRHIELPFIEGGSLTIGDTEGQETDKIVDKAALIQGLQIMAKDYPYSFYDFVKENDDANTADVFFQCVVYGKTIFG